MDQDHVERVAYGGALHLRIEDDRQHFSGICAFIHEDVADADAAGNDRDRGVFQSEAMQIGTTARNNHVDVLIRRQHFLHQLAFR